MRHIALHKPHLHFVAACAAMGLSFFSIQAAPCPVPATPPSHPGGIAKIIQNIASSPTGSDLAAARTAAIGQAAGNGTALGYHSTKRCDFQRFEGKYTPPALPADKAGKYEYGLAIFSDDGTNVKVNGQQMLSRYGRGQGLPNTEKSFTVLSIVLVPEIEADFVVDYSNTHYTGNDDIDGCTLFFYLVPKLPIEFITPAGDPVASPVDAGVDPASIPDGANEFTYSSAAPGVLTIKLKARLSDLESMPDAEKDKFTFEIDGIGNSTFTWDATNPDGKPTISGDILTATATYTDLPLLNKDFGLKKARVMYEGAFLKEEDFEVFYTGTASNHQDLVNPTYPNWFVYYKQNYGGGVFIYRDSVQTISRPGKGDASIEIANDAYLKDANYYFDTKEENGNLMLVKEIGGLTSYYKSFVGVLEHERHHANNETLDKTLDTDGDFLASDFELATSKTLPNNPYSADGAGLHDDSEVYANGPIEKAAINSADTSRDWANPGSNKNE